MAITGAEQRHKRRDKGVRFLLQIRDVAAVGFQESFRRLMGEEDTREIRSYLMLSKLGIPTLPLLGRTENAILLPDVDASGDYRLGEERDLSDR
mgnify:CR=1 FL=1